MPASSSTELPPLERHIAARLRLARERRSLSAAEVADRLGMTTQQLSRYETARFRISTAKLYRLATFYGLPVDWFFSGYTEEALEGVADPTGEYEWEQARERLMQAERDDLERHWAQLSPKQREALMRLLDALKGT